MSGQTAQDNAHDREPERMNRRTFLGAAGAAAITGAAMKVAPSFAMDGKRRFGIQLWSVAKMLSTDFEGTIAMLAGLGYRELETYGPYTFSDPRQIEGWKKTAEMVGFSGSGFFGQSTAQINAVFAEHDLTVPSMHTDLFTLQTRMGPLAEAARALGATYVTLPSLPADQRATVDDYKRAADLFNGIGEDATRHGVRFAYHNHGYGLVPVDGKVPLDTLLDATDPAHVFFEMDTYWTTAGGADPKDYLARYKGRYRMMHLKDMKGQHRFAGDGGAPSDWISMFPHLTYLGDGSLDMAGIIAAAKESGVEHFFVEQDRADDLIVAITGSANYMKKIGFE
ncbi:MAG: sugar phosphate isomerase/epimerase [Novosphingobium sp.]|uniref:sugar phosphate isomerase/epimerase family protein n=1 Tax=Novosphingobium sp. TaxID=1874826 RepID=UPI002733886A|nr:sugar phosphate isomerase/epimerase [Novosphingobium sp.]MDP3550192.1 sugar phosphate isomerase/epimerase [Novosphingobium sp.]